MRTILRRIKFCFNIADDFSSFLSLVRAYFVFSLYIRQGDSGRQKLQSQDTFHVSLNLNNVSSDIHMRVQDMVIFFEIFEEGVYDQEILIDSKDWIIDLGANIGLSANYFHAHLDDYDSILCVEPSHQNLPLLQENTKSIQRININKAAIDIYAGSAHFNDSEFGHLSKVDIESESDYTIDVVTIDSLIKANNIKSVGLIKIDIEGKEYEIMSGDTAWLSIVKNMVIEIHDMDFEKELDTTMESYNFSKKRIKEDIFWYSIVR